MVSHEIYTRCVSRNTCHLLLLMRYVLKIIFVGLLAFHCTQATILAGSDSIGVVYPVIREPYRSVFESIMAGIEQHAGSRVKRFALKGSEHPQNLNQWVHKNNINTVIALGKSSHKLSRSLSNDKRIIIGAVLMSSDLDGNEGIVLNPEPKAVFAKLRQFASNIKQISVIYNPKKNAWLIHRAKQAAIDQKIVFHAYPVSDLHQAAKLYRDVLKRQSGTTNAIWLLNDRSVFDNNVILPLVLQEAWNRRFLVFSNNPVHVKRGVLFATYPNNSQMGISLAKLALEDSQNKSVKTNQMLPLRDLLVAFNLRTAEHLDLDVDRKQRDNINLVFPAQ